MCTPLVGTRRDLPVVSPEGWDEGARSRAGQEFPTVAVRLENDKRKASSNQVCSVRSVVCHCF